MGETVRSHAAREWQHRWRHNRGDLAGSTMIAVRAGATLIFMRAHSKTRQHALGRRQFLLERRKMAQICGDPGQLSAAYALIPQAMLWDARRRDDNA
jgi:hypothetical protein